MFKRKWIVEGRFAIVDPHSILGKKREFSWDMVAGPFFLASTAKRLNRRFVRFAVNLMDEDSEDYGVISREYRVTKI